MTFIILVYETSALISRLRPTFSIAAEDGCRVRSHSESVRKKTHATCVHNIYLSNKQDYERLPTSTMERSQSNSNIGYSYMNRRPKSSISNHSRISLCSCDAARLEDELIHLRESTKQALKTSWDEVESLQNKNSIHKENIARLREDLENIKKELIESKKREKEEMDRNEKLTEKIKAMKKVPFYRSIHLLRRLSEPTSSNKEKTLNKTVHDFRSKSNRRSSMPTSFLPTKTFPLLVTTEPEAVPIAIETVPSIDSTSHSYPSLKARKVSFQDMRDCDPPTRRRSSCIVRNSRGSRTKSFRSRQSKDNFNIKESSIVVVRESSSDESFGGRPAMDEKDFMIKDLQSKLKTREAAINNMEETILQNIKNMQELHLLLESARCM